jgi:hypothetical protein
VRRVDRTSKTKIAHLIHIRHRDEVEAPISDWLQEAYSLSDVLAPKPAPGRPRPKAKARKQPARRKTAKPSKTARKRVVAKAKRR